MVRKNPSCSQETFKMFAGLGCYWIDNYINALYLTYVTRLLKVLRVVLQVSNLFKEQYIQQVIAHWSIQLSQKTQKIFSFQPWNNFMIYHKYVLQSQHFKFHNFVLICDPIIFHFHSWVSRHICWFYILFIIKSLAIIIVCMYLFVHLASFLLSVYPGNVQGRLCRSIFMFCVKFNLISIVDTLTYNLTYNGYRFLYSFFIIWVLSRISWNVFVNMTIYW